MDVAYNVRTAYLSLSPIAGRVWPRVCSEALGALKQQVVGGSKLLQADREKGGGK